MTQKDLIMARADAYAVHRYVDGAQGSGQDHNDKRTVRAREVLQEAVVALEAQNQALLEALKKITVIENEMYGPDWEEIENARQIARAAIYLAEGKDV